MIVPPIVVVCLFCPLPQTRKWLQPEKFEIYPRQRAQNAGACSTGSQPGCNGNAQEIWQICADELAIFVLTDADAAIAVEEACKARVEAQIKVCEGYCPAAVPRLQNAVISRRGETVLFAVGDREIIDAVMEEKNI